MTVTKREDETDQHPARAGDETAAALINQLSREMRSANARVEQSMGELRADVKHLGERLESSTRNLAVANSDQARLMRDLDGVRGRQDSTESRVAQLEISLTNRNTAERAAAEAKRPQDVGPFKSAMIQAGAALLVAVFGLAALGIAARAVLTYGQTVAAAPAGVAP